MPKRSYYKRRGSGKRFKRAFKRYTKRYIKKGQMLVHKFQRVWFAESVTTTNTGITSKAYNIALSSLPNYTEFTALFDQYKITGAKIMIVPTINSINLPAVQTAATTANVGSGYLVTDYDDASPLASVADALQYENLRIFNLATDKVIKRYIVPHMAVAAYSGAFTSYANKYPQWIDSNSPGVQHYGFKVIFDQAPNANTFMTYNIFIKAYVKCKNVR